MIVRLVLWPLTLIIYASWPLKAWEWGAFWGVIFIRPEHRDYEPIHAHELQHARQFWRWLGFGFMVLYTLSRTWRLRFEAEAYRAQLACVPFPDQQRYVYADMLVKNYDLNINMAEALAALEG